MLEYPEDWTEEDGVGWSPSRWNKSGFNMFCGECDERIVKIGDQDKSIAKCPNENVYVHST